MSTSDAIAIGAGVLGAGLTVLGLVVAIASFWGISTIRNEARENAERTARAEVLRLLASDSEIHAKIKAQVETLIKAESDRLFEDLSLSAAFSQPEEGGETRAIAEEYPDEP